MPDIHQLPDYLINKIAAGEVIERPASVVKELLENSLDAGATKIQLTIEDGGKKLIRVADNGYGISARQLNLAVAPHATSKIVAEDDLYQIHTLGFRGEALASICSIAHVRLVSRTPEANEASEIILAGGRTESQGISSGPVGTLLEVRDLFFNVPARRKFLRGAETELGHIQEQLARIALVNPQVEFELISGRKIIKHLPVCTGVLERIRSFYGEEISTHLLPIHRQERNLFIQGYVGQPAQSRASGKWQYIFLNGRYIRDRIIQHAIKESFRGLMEPSRFPVVFLTLAMDPTLVDVNVHPTKIEVRWQDSNMVYSQILSALRETLLKSDLTPSLIAERWRPMGTENSNRHFEREKIAEFFKRTLPAYTTALLPDGRSMVDFNKPEITYNPPEPVQPFELSMPSMTISAPALELEAFSSPPPVIQLHRTYLVTETEEGMLIIDQHALHERILYEQLKQRMVTHSLESQRLLIPEVVRLTARQVALLFEQDNLLKEVGVELSIFGEDAIAIHSFPSLLKPQIAPDFIRNLADRLIEKGERPITETLIHEILDMMACKAAVKAGDLLTEAEIHSLIQQKHLVEKSSNCPHGRPTTLRFTLTDLQRQFKRT